MLTGYQCEVVAFTTDGSFVCPDCARAQYGEIAVAAAENGLNSAYDLSPIIRYSLDDLNSERVYGYAQEIADKREIDQDDWQAIDSIVEKLGDSMDETCDECGEVLS